MGMCEDGNCPECQEARKRRENSPEWIQVQEFVSGLQTKKSLAETNAEVIKQFWRNRKK